MLFDLHGRRRRVVQATYLTLAVLMGGGLVFFGIGSDATGGLSEIFGGGNGGGDTGTGPLKDRIERNEERVARGGRGREAAIKELVRDYYSLAAGQIDQTATSFPDDARDELEKAAAAWQRYLKLEPEKPDASLASVAIQLYDPIALNEPAQAQEAARIIAEAENDAPSYVRLVQYAALAGDTRTADLAGQKAIDLAPRSQRRTIRQQVKLAKNPQGAQGGGQPPGG